MKKYKPKPKPQEICLNSNNSYITLIETDALYPNNLHNLSIPQFKISIQKITRDINLLLHMNDNQFWKQLEQNQSLHVTLESCLTVFPRRAFSGYEVNTLLKRETISEKDQNYDYFKIYAHLTKAILYIYYRISYSQTPSQKQLVYNLWLLDIPKLLDLVAIYGESNPIIVGKIIQNTYSTNPNYHYDTLDFFQLIENHKLLVPEDERLVSIDFSPQSLKSKNYSNRWKFMIQQAMQQMFRIKDLLFNLTNFLTFFPQNYIYQLASDYKIQERLLKSLALFLKQSTEDWKLGQYQKYFQFHLQDIRQSIAKYFILEFKVLRNILESYQQKDLQQVAQNTYETLCLTFSLKKKQDSNRYFRRMINILIQHSTQQIFFLPAKQLRNPDKRIWASLQECVKYETQYRNSKLIASNIPLFYETYQKFKQNLGKWKLMNQKRPSESTLKFQQAKQQQRKLRQPTSYDIDKISKLKYKFISVQYDDDVQETDQFARFEQQQVAKKQKFTNVSMFMQKSNIPSDNYYQVGKIKTIDPDLSVWSGLSSHENDQTSKSLLKNQLSINNYLQTSIDQTKNFKENIKQNSSVMNLSLIRGHLQQAEENKKVKYTQKDLSFSLNASMIDSQINNLSIFKDNHESKNKQEIDQLTSLLAQINSLSQFDEKDDKNYLDVSYQQELNTFEWESQSDFSFFPQQFN